MTRRLAIVVVLVSLLAIGFTVDANDDTISSTEPAPVDSRVFPMASAPGSLSSTWFCAGGSADAERFADHVVSIANPLDVSVTATVTVFGGNYVPPLESAADEFDEQADGDEEPVETTTTVAVAEPEPTVVEIDLGPFGSEELALSDVVATPVASALVEIDAGGVVVEHRISSIHGIDVKPCATTASETWHFAFGATTVDAREILVLFNPFPDDAIVDGIFSTEDAVREPLRFSGLVVPAESTLAVDLGDDVTRRAEVAGTLRTRSGRIVADRIVRYNGSDGPRGLTLATGVPEPLPTWIFTEGLVSDGVRERYVLYNPGEQSAEIEISFVVDEPEVNGVPEPVLVTVPPGRHRTIDLSVDGRLPAGVAHGAVVETGNGVPIVAERVLDLRGTRRGVTVTSGSPVTATEWFFAAGAANDDSDEFLVVLNRDPQVIADLDVFALANGTLLPLADLQGFEVAPGERQAIRLGVSVNRDQLPLVVRSTEPVVIERGVYLLGGDARGASTAVGIPSEATVQAPLDPLAVEVDVDLGDTSSTTVDPDAPPTAPDDVELPAPDETIDVGELDPDADADIPGDDTVTTTTAAPPESTTTTTAPDDGGVPDTVPE